jgi:fused signal recognition particle receptor
MTKNSIAQPESNEKAGLFKRLKDGLSKSREMFASSIRRTLAGRTRIDESLFEDLERILIEADIGVETSLKLVDGLRDELRQGRIESPEDLCGHLKQRIADILKTHTGGPPAVVSTPHVILVAGVNGSGKTTTIAKLAAQLKSQGNKVLLAAADTFRAAAAEQLDLWAERVGAEIVKHQQGSDPAAVAFDAAEAAIARGCDYLIVDTAGRLHTKTNLMEELKKTARVLGKKIDGAPHQTLLVLDATTGQNGLSQARLFTEALGITGIVLAKLDGTAKGGIVIAIQEQLDIPVRFIGIGETLEDLRDFDPEEFVEALFQET